LLRGKKGSRPGPDILPDRPAWDVPAPPPAAGERSIDYRNDIDGLRAVAVMLVLLFHFDVADVFRAGFVGVDIFFVISGFLIVSILRRQLARGTFRARGFYANRIRRLAPALLATTTLTLAFGWALLMPGELFRVAKEAIAAQLYVSNIYYWRFLSYFGLKADLSALLHTWSLGVEEQFYLVFPAALWLVWRWRSRSIATFLVVVFVASFALNLVAIHWKPEATFYLLPTRAWEFAAGALVPELIVLALRWRVPPWLFAVVGLGGVAASMVLYREDVLFPGAFAALPVASTVALLMAGADPRGLYTRAAGHALPAYVGRISYELYLVHWPVRVFAPMVVLDYSLGARLVCLGLCFPLAAAMYHGLGLPVRKKRLLRSGRQLVLAYVAGTAAVLAFAAGAVVTSGFPDRLNPAVRQLASRADDADLGFRPCEGRPLDPCRIGQADQPASWLVFGDSHADALGGAFDLFLKNRRAGGYFTFVSSCLPVLDSGNADCRAFNRRILEFLSIHPEVRSVVLVSTWRQPLERGYVDRAGRLVEGDAAIAAFRENLRRTISAVQSTGRTVVVWLPVPGARKIVPETLARSEILGRHWDLRFSGAEYQAQFRFLIEELERMPDVVLIRPAAHLCASGVCQVEIDGRPLYHDNAHPAGSQAPYFASLIEHDVAAASFRRAP
jgi:peptidoglycan/LPS O-acetylase OafA/YrhL